jgi:DNA-binding CsgD family transcriptional regulator/tetratricopeptide (TPR) repeat protein
VAPVLTALALRPRQAPERFAATLEQAHRDFLLTRFELTALTRDEALALLGERVDATDAARLYQESGGNPFYLEQLARSAERADGAGRIAPRFSTVSFGVPRAVAASLSEELALLSADARLLLEGAAVAGEPFELDLAAAAAGTSEAAALNAIDDLLELDLVRDTDVPRRFRFRHPLVRRAVYDASSSAWRLGAHERCDSALAQRGASAAARAHHVERSARQGDADAAGVLREAGEVVARLAPESAAQWFGGALRLLPDTTPARERVELLMARSAALAAAGHFTASYEAMLEAAAIVPEQLIDLGTSVATTCASVERFLGRYEQAHARLVTALHRLPEPASVESVELLIELTLNEFYRSRYDVMHEWSEHAVSTAELLGDRCLTAAALVVQALADAMTGPTQTAQASRAQAAAIVDELPDHELASRPDAASWLAAAELYLDLYPEADLHATRARELARATGRGDPLFRLYAILPRIWYMRGKLAEAGEFLDGAIEAGRLVGSPPALAGNLFNRSMVALAVGDLDLALVAAEEGVERTRELDEGFVSAWAAVRLAAVLLETAQPARASEILIARAGGEELALIPAGSKAFGLELLTRSWLALDRVTDAERAANQARAVAAAGELPLATAWADRASAAVALHTGHTADAVEHALAAADAAHGAGAPIEEGLSRTLAGCALVKAGRVDRAIAELQHAATAFEDCGAVRYREAAERELGKLGHRPHRRTRAGNNDGTPIASLTGRELQVAQLVVDRRTNPEIAAELFLSQKTVETHLRNIFRKIGVSSRVELARAVESEALRGATL